MKEADLPDGATPITTRHRVAFYETDGMGIVHHANYLRFCENARIVWLETHDKSYPEWLAMGLHFAVTHAELDFRLPARFDDDLEITTYRRGDPARFRRTGGSSCTAWNHMGEGIPTVKYFDATDRIDNINADVLGATLTPDGSGLVFAFDVATCTCPPDCPLTACSDPTWETHELVQWNPPPTETFTQFEGVLPVSPVFALTLTPETCPGLDEANPDDPGDVDLCSASWRTPDGTKLRRSEWVPRPGVEGYHVYRGSFDHPMLTQVECLSTGDVEDVQFVDLTDPDPGKGYYYLIAEVIDNTEQTLGENSDGVPRVIDADCDAQN